MPEIPQHVFVLLVFGTVYLGMILGGLPWLKLDRTGIALLGAIALVGGGVLTVEEAARGIDLPTILLLFSFMVISAQMRLGGFYVAVTRGLDALPVGPGVLLALVIAVAALLSAVFTNDIVCLAMTPVLVEACLRRRLDPVPYLLALACASNIGSAATLIGNPQNMLIGQALQLPFAGYALDAIGPVLASLALLWLLLVVPLRRAGAAAPVPAVPRGEPPGRRPAASAEPEPFDAWQTTKGLAVSAALMVIFLATDWRHDVAALVGAAVLLLSERFHSSRMLALIDWPLLVLFMGLFVVNHALQQSGLPGQALQGLARAGVDLNDTATLFAATLGLSNLVSNVPAVMLLLPAAAGPGARDAGTVLALVSTLAGNLLIVGSIANIIVVDAARRYGIEIDWRRHARIGVPVTLASLAVVALWLHGAAP
ncbi:MAG TPA: anion transporter [Rubrivivax sp.]|nr:anion transporter [Rubrivivax sp.]